MTKFVFDSSDTSIILSKDESGFQAVVDDFPNANRISVVTFNISWKDRTLLNSLNAAGCPATIISNIPHRLSRGYRGKYDTPKKNSAQWQIQQYMQQLDPNRFDAHVEAYFAFENHAKIIMTDNIAYIGSANYSEESKRNWECGVITTDARAIAELEAAIEELKIGSVRYFGDPREVLLAPFVELQGCLAVIDDKIDEECMGDISSLLDNLENAIASVDRLWASEFATGGPYTSQIDMEVIEIIRGLIDESEELREYAQFDPDNLFIDAFPSDAYGDRLQIYLATASEENSHRLEELELKAEESISRLKIHLATVCEQIEQVLGMIQASITSIDNTRDDMA